MSVALHWQAEYDNASIFRKIELILKDKFPRNKEKILISTG